MLQLFEQAGYMAHGYCLLWEPWLIVLYAGSDLLIFLSYAAIPIGLIGFARLRPDFRQRHLLWLFAAFILLCGLTHLISIAVLWVPVYEVHGWAKLATGVVSATTAIVLFPLVPKLAALPSPAQLETANGALRQEVAAHETTLARLRETLDGLETQVAERTQELRMANAQLTVVLSEAAHRNNNMLTVIQSLARQTLRNSKDLEDFGKRFGDRLAAMARATTEVARSDGSRDADLGAMANTQLDAYRESYPDQIEVDGPEVRLTSTAAQQIALALHELATNAVKYGALAHVEGRVRLSWNLARDRDTPVLELSWEERNAPGFAAGTDPETTHSSGLGRALVEEIVPAQVGGEASLSITDNGLDYQLKLPLKPNEGR
ncbi:sensor histidine kinase [Lutimaribacter marinistellae]|uniref:histidine kinase n=1 Tax=Lutimaribacter marinistellae TaxID=1820329 RepID=A0ABV7TJ15_9RHOB